MSSSAPMRLGLIVFLFSFTWRKNIEPLNTFTLWFRCQTFLLPCVLSFIEEPHCCSVSLGAGLGCSRDVSGGVSTRTLLGVPSKTPLRAYSVVSPPATAQGCQVQLTHSAPTWVYASNECLVTVFPDPLPAVPSLGGGSCHSCCGSY